MNIEAAQTQKGVEMQEFVETVLEDMSTTTDSHISEATDNSYTYGFSLFEIIAKQRNGYEFDNIDKCSKFDDGLIGIAKLASRPPESLYRWIMTHEVLDGYPDNGDVWGFEQEPPNGGGIRRIPLSRCLHYKINPKKGNPEGTSAFRNAYRPWYFLKYLEEYEAMGYERNLGGLPIARIPDDIFQNATGFDKNGNRLPDAVRNKAIKSLNSYAKMVSDVKKNERGGIVIPSNTYLDNQGNPTNVKRVDFDLLTAKSADIKIGDPISRKQQEIARTMFAQFIMLGSQSASGNRNLSQNISDLFLASIDGWLERVANVYNKQLLPYLWHLNEAAGFDIKDMPTISFDSVKDADLSALGDYIAKMGATGITLGGDDDTENWLREQAGIPEKNEDTEA